MTDVALLINLTLGEIIFTIINFFVIALICTIFLFKPVMKVIKTRKEKISAELTEIEEQKFEIDQVKKEYEGKIEEAYVEARKLRYEALEDANKIHDQIIQEAKKEADFLYLKAKEHIIQEREQNMREHSKEIIMIASGMAEKIMRKELQEQDQQNLIEMFLQELENTKE